MIKAHELLYSVSAQFVKGGWLRYWIWVHLCLCIVPSAFVFQYWVLVDFQKFHLLTSTFSHSGSWYLLNLQNSYYINKWNVYFILYSITSKIKNISAKIGCFVFLLVAVIVWCIVWDLIFCEMLHIFAAVFILYVDKLWYYMNDGICGYILYLKVSWW